MRVKVMVGNKVIKDSSANRIAKVIDPEPEVVSPDPAIYVNETTERPKDAIFNRNEVPESATEVETDVPKDAIFNRIDKPVHEEFLYKYKEEEPKYVDVDIKEDDTKNRILNTADRISKEVEDSTQELIDELKKEAMEAEVSEDPYEDEDDYEEDEMKYEQYMSNRERSQLRKAQKSNRSNTDFESF